MQSLGFGLPVVERSRDANGDGRRMSELKSNGNELEAGAAAVIMIFIVLHKSSIAVCPMTVWRGSQDIFC